MPKSGTVVATSAVLLAFAGLALTGCTAAAPEPTPTPAPQTVAEACGVLEEEWVDGAEFTTIVSEDITKIPSMLTSVEKKLTSLLPTISNAEVLAEVTTYRDSLLPFETEFSRIMEDGPGKPGSAQQEDLKRTWGTWGETATEIEDLCGFRTKVDFDVDSESP